jgi:hypothetical protein
MSTMSPTRVTGVCPLSVESTMDSLGVSTCAEAGAEVMVVVLNLAVAVAVLLTKPLLTSLFLSV